MNHNNKLQKIHSGTIIEIKKLKEQLEKHNISCLVKDDFADTLHAGLGGALSVIDLYVFQEDMDKALAFIEKQNQE